MLICACQQRSSEKEPIVSPAKDSVVAAVKPAPKVEPKKVKIKKLLPTSYEKLSVVFYDSLTAFHKKSKVIDTVTKRDFADTSIIVLRGDSVRHDSITIRFAVRSDREETFKRFFVRYDYRTSDTMRSTLFYIWKEKSGKIQYLPIQCDCEFKNKDPEILPIDQKDIQAIMNFFMEYLALKSEVFF